MLALSVVRDKFIYVSGPCWITIAEVGTSEDGAPKAGIRFSAPKSTKILREAVMSSDDLRQAEKLAGPMPVLG